jgi:hypothetical protein
MKMRVQSANNTGNCICGKVCVHTVQGLTLLCMGYVERGKLVFGQPWTRLDVMCSNTKTTTTTTKKYWCFVRVVVFSLGEKGEEGEQ